jgi:hypothetical protein
MAVYAIPIYLYVEADSPAEAQTLKKKTETLLANPLVKTALRQSGINDKGTRVLDPQLSQP